MAAQLKRIVLEFDDGTTHEIGTGYTAVYKNAGRARRANEQEPWEPPPHRERGKGDAGDGSTGSKCYDINGVIVCP